jgi:hypothetical protein
MSEGRHCHLCLGGSDLEPGKNGDGRWWCSDYRSCDERARRRLFGEDLADSAQVDGWAERARKAIQEGQV